LEIIKKFIIKSLREALTPSEEQMLQEWMAQSIQNRKLVEEMNDPKRLAEAFAKLDSLRAEQMRERVKAFSKEQKELAAQNIYIGRRGYQSRTGWLYFAASFIVLLGIGALLWLEYGKKDPAPIVKQALPQDVPAPSSSHAWITLANGQKIFIDSVPNGMFATQGNVRIE